MNSEGIEKRVLSTLLNEMDGIENTQDLLVVAATNRPDMIDSALLRPGRLDHLLYVPPPDFIARIEIFKVHTKNSPLDKDVNLEELAKLTENYTGAEIQALCREAAFVALREDINQKFIVKYFKIFF